MFKSSVTGHPFLLGNILLGILGKHLTVVLVAIFSTQMLMQSVTHSVMALTTSPSGSQITQVCNLK